MTKSGLMNRRLLAPPIKTVCIGRLVKDEWESRWRLLRKIYTLINLINLIYSSFGSTSDGSFSWLYGRETLTSPDWCIVNQNYQGEYATKKVRNKLHRFNFGGDGLFKANSITTSIGRDWFYGVSVSLSWDKEFHEYDANCDNIRCQSISKNYIFRFVSLFSMAS